MIHPAHHTLLKSECWRKQGVGDDICTDLENLYRSKLKNSLGSGEHDGLYLEIEISVYSPNKETCLLK